MALKFNYNKTTIQTFRRQLAIRERALPILKNKETALRREIKVLKKELISLQEERSHMDKQIRSYGNLWTEMPNILFLEDIGLHQKRVIGVQVPEIKSISFKVADISWWRLPAWVPLGIDILKKIIRMDIQMDIYREQVEKLEEARKKTTQKVNLYEKVQIPAYEEAIIKIKRFLEDKENISKAAQKIVKKKKERRKAA